MTSGGKEMKVYNKKKMTFYYYYFLLLSVAPCECFFREGTMNLTLARVDKKRQR